MTGFAFLFGFFGILWFWTALALLIPTFVRSSWSPSAGSV
jgi:hypothetical protein